MGELLLASLLLGSAADFLAETGAGVGLVFTFEAFEAATGWSSLMKAEFWNLATANVPPTRLLYGVFFYGYMI